MGRERVEIDWRAHELLSDVRTAACRQRSVLRRLRARVRRRADAGEHSPAAAELAVAEPAGTVPAAESDAGLPRLEPAAGEPPTVTVMAGRPVAPASAPPPPSLASLELETISEWAEPAGPPPRGARRGRVPTLWILLAVIVPLAAGGGTFGLVKLASQHAAGPGAAPASTAVTTAPTQPASTQPVSPQASCPRRPHRPHRPRRPCRRAWSASARGWRAPRRGWRWC